MGDIDMKWTQHDWVHYGLKIVYNSTVRSPSEFFIIPRIGLSLREPGCDSNSFVDVFQCTLVDLQSMCAAIWCNQYSSSRNILLDLDPGVPSILNWLLHLSISLLLRPKCGSVVRHGKRSEINDAMQSMGGSEVSNVMSYGFGVQPAFQAMS